jgi:hypothetical protein
MRETTNIHWEHGKHRHQIQKLIQNALWGCIAIELLPVLDQPHVPHPGKPDGREHYGEESP